MLNSSFVTVELGVGFGVVGEMVEFGVAGDAVLPGKLPLHEAKELRMTNSDKIETFLELFIDTIPFKLSFMIHQVSTYNQIKS